MFRYSIDELIAGEQKAGAEKLLDGLKEKCNPQHCLELEELFQKLKINSYAYLEEVNQLSVDCQDNVIMVAVKRDNNTADQVQWDLKKAFDKLEKPWKDPLPYIELSFSEDYDCPHGESAKHIYLFFFTKYHDYEGSRDSTIHYFTKFSRLKAFI